jgi:hypothetical protein
MSAIPTSARKELFQLGYLQSLIAPIGIEILKADSDYDKVDCLLKYPGYVFSDDLTGGAIVQIQLKATSSPEFIADGSIISFQIEKLFCHLVHNEQSNWRFLFVLICPPKETNWVMVDNVNNSLILNHKMYWAGLRDIPKIASNDLTGSKNIHIPITHVVDQHVLKRIMSAQANKNLDVLYAQDNRGSNNGF